MSTQIIRWMTPRIRLTEFFDDQNNRVIDLAYRVWDDFKQEDFEKVKKHLKDGCHRHQMKVLWYDAPCNESGVEERRFVNFIDFTELHGSMTRIKQFVANVGCLWNWRPEIYDYILHDLNEFISEIPKYTKEWYRWYRPKRQKDQYRKPHFYEEDLLRKLPMGCEKWRKRNHE